MLIPLLAGLGLGFSLIIAIGAQNLFVLRQGLRREHVLVVAALCAVSDALLIGLGVSGIGLVLQALPWLVTVVRWAGALFLVGYGLLALRRATRPTGLEATAPASRGSVVATTLAITFLNPHVYLDTVLMLGSIANGFEDERWAFAGGAVVGRTVWFTGLALGARALARPLASPRTWRVLDAVIGVTMIGLGVLLAL